MKLSDIILEEQNKVSAGAKAINNAIISVDEDMHYGVFAKAIAKVLRDEYGTHNFQPFMKELHDALGYDDMNEMDTTHEYQNKERELKDQVVKASGIDGKNIAVGMRASSSASLKTEKGSGYIRFNINDTVDPTAFEQVMNILKAKGYTVTKKSNFYDVEPGERSWYPTIDFEFEI